jgi:hypothetical protein
LWLASAGLPGPAWFLAAQLGYLGAGADPLVHLALRAPTQAAFSGPAPALGTARPARAADPGPGPSRVPEHPRDPALPGRCAETRQARPRTAARVKEPAPSTRHDVGKTTKRDASLKARRERAG